MKAEARLPCPLLHLSLHLGVPTQLLEDLNKYEERFEGLKFELKKKKKKKRFLASSTSHSDYMNNIYMLIAEKI